MNNKKETTPKGLHIISMRKKRMSETSQYEQLKLTLRQLRSARAQFERRLNEQDSDQPILN